MPNTPSLPTRYPIGTKYVLERYGRYVRRYIEYPDGRRVQLPSRKALPCSCMELQQIGIVPDRGPAAIEAPAHRDPVIA